jgi:hypothetical protein
MTSSCVAAAAAATASKRALDAQAVSRHSFAVAADTAAAVKHGNAIASHATVATTTTSAAQNAMLNLKHGGA